MRSQPRQHHRNRLLGALSRSDLALLAPHLRPVALALHQKLETANARIGHAYFIEEGIASVIAVGPQQRRIEVGLIGPEGVTAVTVVLGNHRSPNATFVQAAGEAQRIGVGDLRKAMAASRTLHALFMRYALVFMAQTAQTAVANGRATLEERLARWILMAQDRVGRNRMPLTHAFLALMLGVRRAGVTDTLNKLEGEGLIRALRGEVIVLDRGALEQRASQSYGVPEAEYRRLIGRSGRADDPPRRLAARLSA